MAVCTVEDGEGRIAVGIDTDAGVAPAVIAGKRKERGWINALAGVINGGVIGGKAAISPLHGAGHGLIEAVVEGGGDKHFLCRGRPRVDPRQLPPWGRMKRLTIHACHNLITACFLIVWVGTMSIVLLAAMSVGMLIAHLAIRFAIVVAEALLALAAAGALVLVFAAFLREK